MTVPALPTLPTVEVVDVDLHDGTALRADAMNQVNEAMGYRVVEHCLDVQKALAP